MIDEGFWNMETTYASIIGIIFVFSSVWYLMRHEYILLSIGRSFREWIPRAKEAARADWRETRTLICETKELKTMEYVCESCGKEFENGVIIVGRLFCAACAMTPEAIAIAQNEMLKKRGDF